MGGKYKPYPNYKASGIEWLGDVPAHWEVRPLKYTLDEGRLVRGPFGSDLKKDMFVEQGIKIYEQKNAIQQNCNIGNSYITLTKFNEMKRFQVQENDYIMSCSGTVGQVLRISKKAHQGIINQALLIIRFDQDVFLLKFSDWLFISSFFVEQILDNSQGGAVKNLVGIDIFKSIKFAIPPLAEQQQIVDFLDREVGKIEALIAKQERLVELLTEKRQAVISHAVTKGLNPNAPMKPSAIEWLGDIPEHWDVKALKSLFVFYKGLTITKEDLKDSGVPCVNYGEIHSKYNFEIDLNKHQLKYVDKSYLNTFIKSLVYQGDIVFADTSEDIDGAGNFTQLVSNAPIFAGYHTIILKMASGNYYRYLAYAFDTIEFRSQIRSKVQGIKVFSITQAILKNSKIWLPSLSEQQQIAEFLDQETKKIDSLIQKAQHMVILLKERKIALISAAVTGKIDVRNQN